MLKTIIIAPKFVRSILSHYNADKIFVDMTSLPRFSPVKIPYFDIVPETKFSSPKNAKTLLLKVIEGSKV